MKFSLMRPALVLGAALTLASCGGGGKATYPIHVDVYGLQYPGLVMSTNGQDLPITGTSDQKTPIRATFPNQIEYGQVYTVLPKGATPANLRVGSQPLHQYCEPTTTQNQNTTSYTGPYTSTAGLLATIEVAFICTTKSYPVGGKIVGLTGTGLVLINGSNGGAFAATPVPDATTKLPTDIAFGPYQQDLATAALTPVTYGNTYGVSVLTQPTGQTCTVSGGTNGIGGGTMDDAAETAGGVSNIVVTCKP